MTWERPTGAQWFEYRASEVGNEAQAGPDGEGPRAPDNETLFTKLWCSTNYDFMVRAQGNGQSYSSKWSAWTIKRETTDPYTPPPKKPASVPKPTGFTLEAKDDGTIKATWDEQTGVVSYDLGQRIVGTATWTRLADKHTDHTYTTGKLDCNKEYKFRIRGYGDEVKYKLGPSAWIEVTVTPECVIELEARLTLNGNTILNVLRMDVIEDGLIVMHIEETSGQSIPESYRFRLISQPAKTGAEIAPSDRQCKWNGSSRGASDWFSVRRFHGPDLPLPSGFVESIRVLRCHLGEGTGSLLIEVQDGLGGNVTTLASTGILAEAVHQHMVNGNLTLTFGASLQTLDGRRTAQVPGDYNINKQIELVKGKINLATKWSNSALGITFRPHKDSGTPDVAVKGYWTGLNVCPTSIACVGPPALVHIGPQTIWFEFPAQFPDDVKKGVFRTWTTDPLKMMLMPGSHAFLPDVMVHEFGHTLGLGHPDSSITSAMVGYQATVGPKAYDWAALEAMYGDGHEIP